MIPVRGGAAAKSRLDHPLREELARAMALDTIETALKVAPVIVVTDETMAADVSALGATTVPDPGEGLNAAIELALSAVSTDSAVLLGDLPGLEPAELAEALAAAADRDRALVADADGSGTVLLTARAGLAHALSFGAGSRAAHLAAGYTELLESWPTLRRDVDRVEHLAGTALGPRTRALLGEL